jgi:hypothetical protein
MRNLSARIFLTILLALLVGATAVQAHGAPVLTLDPPIAAAGGTTIVNGSQMEPDLEFAITLERAGKIVSLGKATAKKDKPDAEEAMFADTVTIPTDTKPGSYQIRVTSADGDTASADLTVTDVATAAQPGAAQVVMASGDLHVLDRSRSVAQVTVLGAIAALLVILGIWMARRPETLA